MQKIITATHEHGATEPSFHLLRLVYRWRWVGGAALAAVLVRVLLVLCFPDLKLQGDEVSYFDAAQRIAAGRDVPQFPYRPPFYPFFLASVLKLTGGGVVAVRVVQALIEGVTTILAAVLTRRISGSMPAGGLAAWTYAFYPEFIAYSHYLWSETLVTFLLAAGMLALFAFADEPTPSRGLMVAVPFACLHLAKPYHILILPILLVVICFGAELKVRTRLITLGIAAVIVSVAPATMWSAYVSSGKGAIVFVSMNGAHAVRLGTNATLPARYDFGFGRRPDPAVHQITQPLQHAVLFAAKNPMTFVERIPEKWSLFWAPNSFLIRKVFSGCYGPLTPGNRPIRLTVASITMTLIMLLTLGGVVGCAFRWPTRGTTLPAAYTVTMMAMCTVTVAASRFRLPLMLFAVVLSAAAIQSTSEQGASKHRSVASIVLVCLLVGLGLLWSMHLPRLVEALIDAG